jgi:hypothetical protein
MGDMSRAKAEARDLCNSCPVRKECGEWVSRAENPAGAWHGMFAGRTPAERERSQSLRGTR